MATKDTMPGWSELKAKLADFDRAGLVGLVQDLYPASKDHHTFLHARFGLGDNVLKPCKDTISHWIRPQDPRPPISVAKARKAISDYRKAVGHAEGLAGPAMSCCEDGFVFSRRLRMGDPGYFAARIRMLEQALKTVKALPEPKRGPFLDGLETVRRQGQDVGWGVGDDLDTRWLAAGFHLDYGTA